MEPNQQDIANQPVFPVASKSHLNLLSTVIVGILMLLVGLGGGYLLFANKTEVQQVATAQVSPTISQINPTSVIKSTVDPTADWQIYTSSQYGYSIKYPKTVTYKQDRFYLLGDDKRKDTADGFGPELQVLFRGSSSDPLTVAKQEIGNVKFKNFEINNATGVEVINSSLGGFDYYLYPKSGSGNIIRLLFNPQNYSGSVTKENINTMQAISTQMLSTFKFTE
jgi:hypothetical protein